MYLKQLEILGFKSFADKTLLKLNHGINIVVGPNGCGKSNILDAIRWVLGEQKTTILRSKQMDEVIFAGTDQRKPAGLCQVSLVLDNSDGKFPNNNPEASITRKLFREGGGHYLIDGKNARLRDVQEAIADTGIGQGALFVLSSREVEQVLSSSPEERRAVIEETAGIKKYQLRKKETLQKLSSTKENISRLNDILQEIERQVEQSRKQLNKLNRYLKVKEKLSRLECIKVVMDIQEQVKKRLDIKSKLDNLQELRIKADKEMDEISFDISSAETERSKCLSVLDKEKDTFSKMSIEEGEIRTGIDITMERVSQAEAACKEYSTRQNQYRERIQTLKNDIAQNELEAQELQKELLQLEDRYRQIQKQLQESESGLQRENTLMEDARQSVLQARERLNLLNVKLQYEEEQQKTGDLRIAENRERLLKLADEIETADEKINTWQAELEKKTEAHGQAKEKLLSFESDQQNKQKEIIDLENKLRELKGTFQTYRSELSNLIREEEDYRGFSEAFRKIMQRQNTLPPLTPIHTIVEVESEFESAAEIVLGGHFQSLITESKQDANICIDFLKREKAGRLTFFPLDMDRSGSSMPSFPMNLPGVVDWAKNIIKCGYKYRDIVDVICGKTLVVENLDSAYKIYNHQKQSHGFTPKMVTLEGDVLEFTGAVTGGRYRADRSQLLSRQRRRRELEDSLRQLTKRVEYAHSKLENLHKEAESVKKTEESLSLMVKKTFDEVTSLSGQLNVLIRVKESALTELSQMKNIEHEIKSSLEESTDKLRTFKEEIKEQEQLLLLGQEKMSQMEAFQKDLHLETQSVKDNLDEVKNRLESVKGKKNVLDSKLESGRAYLVQLQKDLDEVETKIQLKKKEEEEMSASLQTYKNRRSVLNLKMKGLGIALESSKQELAAAENKIEELRNRQRIVMDKKRRYDDEYNEIRFKKVEIDSRIGYLNEKRKAFAKEVRKNAAKTIQQGRAPEDITQEIESTREKMHGFDSINFSAGEEFEEHSKRYETMKTQVEDLQESSSELRRIIREMDAVSLKALEETMQTLNTRFQSLFEKVFNGGQAGVSFTDPENKLESGVDITVQPPGKRAANITLLSSGEKSLTAVTFLFALLSIKPGPFVILDELDAPLDSSNLEKINSLVKEFAQKSQFIVITHNRKTMEIGDMLFGITMEEPGVSKLVSVKMDKET